jgi:hypothetical protein
LPGRLHPAGRLAEKPCPQCERLIRADDELAGMPARYRAGFLAGQQRGNLAGGCQAGGLLYAPLVDVGGNGLEIDTGIGEQQLPGAALRRQDQRKFAAPERHSGSRCRCLSVNNFRIAAAVSSIDRRVTSSCAQLCLALNRRAKATSSATAWRSM